MRTVRDLMDLSGRVALVTGGAGHIGGAIAEALAECGADVVVTNNRWSSSMAARWWFCPADLESPDEIRGLVEGVRRGRSGHLDILVNSAAYLDGPGLDVPFEQQTAADWDRSFAVNLRAPFLLAQACAPMLRASGHGSVINVASIYGVVGPDWRLYEGTGMGNAAAYAASKGGLLQLTRWLATTLAPEVRVNAIVPGGVARGQNPAFVARYCARTPLGRMATEEDIKGVVAFLASDASAYVTGAAIPVEGGWTCW